jgi:hypothetical protein
VGTREVQTAPKARWPSGEWRRIRSDRPSEILECLTRGMVDLLPLLQKPGRPTDDTMGRPSGNEGREAVDLAAMCLVQQADIERR